MHKLFEKNKKGTDYIVGDIHGEFIQLEAELKKINFNPEKDRLFSVGDLINRGRFSEKIFEWMNYDWFFPISGNHEDMVISIINEPESFFAHKFTTNLGKWLLSLNKEEKSKLKQFCEKLPLLQTVTLNDDSLVGMVHANVPFEDWDFLKLNINNPNVREFCLYNSDSIYREEVDTISGIKYLFVGHMVQKEVNKKANVFLIDTGSGYEGKKLSILNLNTQKKVN